VPVNARWVTINGQRLLSITLPQHQHALIDRETGWTLLVYLRAAMREKPPGSTDNNPE
jgi:hypothetical protein